MRPDAIGLDIGGANIKAATASGSALSRPFELWRHPDRLANELSAIRALLPGIRHIAVTMTGELCDCFPTKRDGVRHILAAAHDAFRDCRMTVWTASGLLDQADFSGHDPLIAAAANWLALAQYVGRHAPTGTAVLIDTGSTTTDIVPLFNGTRITTGWTDAERLQSGELVYSGVRRTPVCSLISERVAAEWFATTHDVHVLLGHLPEETENRSTPDGRPMTRDHAHARMSRMLGGDPELTRAGDTFNLARQAFDRQRSLICDGIEQMMARLPDAPRMVILSGSGEFLARTAWADFAGRRSLNSVEVISLNGRLGASLSEAACAYALAVLATEAAECD